jgi:hypothetical protein
VISLYVCVQIPCNDCLRLRVSYIHCVAFFWQQLSTCTIPHAHFSSHVGRWACSCLVNLIAFHRRTCLLAVYDVKLGRNYCTMPPSQFLLPKCCFQMILVLFSHCPHFSPCALARWAYLTPHASNLFSSSPFYTIVMLVSSLAMAHDLALHYLL